jgi:hypothetical protein
VCGIAGYTVREPGRAARLGLLADSLLRAIEPRGRDATGLLALSAGEVVIDKDTLPARRFLKDRKRFQEDVQTLLLHTRFATVGARNDPRNAHPVAFGDVAAVHNGTIFNDSEIFAELGRQRLASVDSEVIPALIDWAGWDEARDAIGLLIGGAAVAMVDVKRTGEVALFRTQSYPLVYMETDDLIVWASTRSCIERAWRETYGRTKMGRFTHLPDWTLVRVLAGEVASTEQIPVSPDAPAPRYESQASLWRPARDWGRLLEPDSPSRKPRRGSAGTTWVPNSTPPSELSAMQAALFDDISEGRWSEDGAFELEEDEDTQWDRPTSLLGMTEQEWREMMEEEESDG